MDFLRPQLVMKRKKNVKELMEAKNEKQAKIVIDRILRDNMVAQLSTNKTINKFAIRELEDLHAMIVGNQVKLGSDSQTEIVKLNTMIQKSKDGTFKDEQLEEELLKDDEHPKSQFKEAIAKTIPNIDSMIGAVTLANPILGFGLSFMKGLKQSAKENDQRIKEKADKELAKLKQEEEILNEEANKQEQLTQLGGYQHSPNDQGLAEEYLKDLSELRLVNEYLDLIDSKLGILIDPENPNNENILSKFEVIKEKMLSNETFKERVNQSDELTKEQLEIEKERLGKEELEQLNNIENKRENTQHNLQTGVESDSEKEDKSSGLFEMLGITALLGSMKTKIMGSVKFIGGLVKRFAPMVLKIGGLLTAPFIGLYNVFTKSEEMFDKAFKDLNPSETIGLFIGGIISSVTGLLDFVTGLFGIDTTIGEDTNEFISKGIADLLGGGWFDSILTGIGQWLGSAIYEGVTFVSDLFEGFDLNATLDYVKNIPSNIVNSITDFTTGIIDNISKSISEFSIVDTLDYILTLPSKLIESITEFLTDKVDSILSVFGVDSDIKGSYKKLIQEKDEVVENVKIKALDTYNSVSDSVKSFFNIQDDVKEPVTNSLKESNSNNVTNSSLKENLTQFNLVEQQKQLEQNQLQVQIKRENERVAQQQTPIVNAPSNTKVDNSTIIANVSTRNNENVINRINQNNMLLGL